ncbi:hypothetical protein MM221_10985 [Salipaludibacillus sp. LMS25]|uniref:hypothetical protein n=1 Tax=Salipaludibacillus sp. LMS25 TaxID=2924031 RepID=UPI0020D05BEE|nr:hypothetical protein [Salipaludibacillus sp. LMS25]UTR13180.1 hypothetical protein MM221_10985 [Salipaludibacillus sp. LMS25]
MIPYFESWNDHYIVNYDEHIKEFANNLAEYEKADIISEEDELAAIHELQEQHANIITALKDIDISHDETQEVHDMLLSANEHLTEGLASLEETIPALFTGDLDTYEQGLHAYEESFIKAQSEEEKYHERWEELIEEFNIEVEEE